MADSDRYERSPGGPGADIYPRAGNRPASPPVRYPSLRQRLFMGLGMVVGIAALLWIGWYILVGSHYVSTDDAYVDAKTAQITPQISGTIISVAVMDTQSVKRGDVLVVIDPTDMQLALAQADADYNHTLGRVRQYYANVDAAAAQVTARKADLERARVDYNRRRALESTGAISGDEMTTARNSLDTAAADLQAAQQELVARKALITSPKPEQNPEVLSAAATRDRARLDVARTLIRAPIDGIVARSGIQIGQHVEVGATLMSIVPVADAYVNANFKEGQLTDVRIGQPATLTSDLYGSGVVFHGKVIGIGGGTGAAFAIIPAQNATGNWIKIVQRLPVRIALDPADLKEHPLRVGLSMTAEINVREKGDPNS
ncbi:MAG: biotin/lipoyl-binding protein [Rhodospirillaceae bacterium]|nr:MAG: biotin/lipoyl-binding protein [Rhodospirillaceae bacterium]